MPLARADLLGLVQTTLDGDKADDAVVIDLAGKTEIADLMVIASGTSQRHVGAMAGHLKERLKAAGISRISIEGEPHCDWVLIDAGDVVIHLFKPEVRTFYNLEKLWSIAPPAPAAGQKTELIA